MQHIILVLFVLLAACGSRSSSHAQDTVRVNDEFWCMYKDLRTGSRISEQCFYSKNMCVTVAHEYNVRYVHDLSAKWTRGARCVERDYAHCYYNSQLSIEGTTLCFATSATCRDFTYYTAEPFTCN